MCQMCIWYSKKTINVIENGLEMFNCLLPTLKNDSQLCNYNDNLLLIIL